MAYRDQLYPWCIVRSIPSAPYVVIARFRRPVDAEAHLRILRSKTPGDPLSIVFEKAAAQPPPSEQTSGQDEPENLV